MKYIVQKDYGTGSGRDDVWHWNSTLTWVQETRTPSITPTYSLLRIVRGNTKPYINPVYGFGWDASNIASIQYGFRPVFEYKE